MQLINDNSISDFMGFFSVCLFSEVTIANPWSALSILSRPLRVLSVVVLLSIVF